jgi:hypothetical protein
MAVIPLIVYSVLLIYELIPLYKQKLWRDFWVNAVLWFCSLTFAVILTFGGEVPNPAIQIQKLIQSLFGK